MFPGNGPSGIVLSYMLAGHWPYYAGCSQDELLHARLMLEPGLSLVEQDLQFLSEVNITVNVNSNGSNIFLENVSEPIERRFENVIGFYIIKLIAA